MPSGGYGIGSDEDTKQLAALLTDANVRKYCMYVEVMQVYVAARLAGALPAEAARAAYEEWDL